MLPFALISSRVVPAPTFEAWRGPTRAPTSAMMDEPEAISLWLLPSGPDQVGDYLVRPTPAAHMGEDPGARKFAAHRCLH